MRQASWNEIFAPRGHEPLVLVDVPQEPSGWRRLFWWEDLLTFFLLGLILLTVVASIDEAAWVDSMPSLYPIAFFGLFLGALLARLPWREGFVHLLALPLGAAASLGQILSILPGPTPWDRYDALHERMAQWFHIAFTGGISNDDLPFIVLVVPLVWLSSYLSSWAIFRWQNVWLALIPAGAALLTNMSFLPGEFSLAFVVFLVGAALLVTRLHLLEQAKAWRERATPYPPLLSLSVLHATFWLGLVLVGLAWLLPQADETAALESLWRRATAPVEERSVELSRLFVSVNNKQSVRVHSFEDILPFLGSIELSDTEVLEAIIAERLEEPRYLRAQSYDIYTSEGWTRAVQQRFFLDAAETTEVDESLLRRLPVVLSVIASGNTGNAIFSLGQPVRFDQRVKVDVARDGSQVTAVAAPRVLRRGERYQAVGSVSAASVDELRAAGTNYPDAVRSVYLRLPDSLPRRVRDLARRLTRDERTPYDKAVTLESYLRTIPYSLNVPDTPPGRDTVDYFLFDIRRGYFDYHASAMVVLLRSLGVPSRLAVGYVLDEGARVPGTSRYRITEANAFAWPEVYFPDYGWVEFNPTPNRPPIVRYGGETDDPAALDGDEAPDLGLGFGNLEDQASGGDAPSADLAAGSPSGDRAMWILAAIGGVLAVFLVSAASGLRYAWVRGLGGLETPARLWGQTVRLASWARQAPAPGQTPREFARSLRERVPGADGAELLAESYVRHRYGREPIDEAQRGRLEQAWRVVRRALVRRLLRLR